MARRARLARAGARQLAGHGVAALLTQGWQGSSRAARAAHASSRRIGKQAKGARHDAAGAEKACAPGSQSEGVAPPGGARVLWVLVAPGCWRESVCQAGRESVGVRDGRGAPSPGLMSGMHGPANPAPRLKSERKGKKSRARERGKCRLRVARDRRPARQALHAARRAEPALAPRNTPSRHADSQQAASESQTGAYTGQARHHHKP